MENSEYRRQLLNRTYLFSLNIIRYIDTLNRFKYSSDIISKQLIRSGTSIGANINEAQSASSKRDFINFITHALKSANESVFWLNLLKDIQINKTEVDKLLNESKELAKIIASSILTLKGKKQL